MTTTLDLEAVKARQQKTWASGHYGSVAALIHPIAEQLVESADLSAGSRVLDVAAGTGNAAIAAARCGCAVTALDYVPELLHQGRARSAAEGFAVDFVEGDAEQMKFADGSFDAVLSVVGVMFAPDHQRAAGELVRVLRPGGTLGLVAWTPEGFIGDLFRTIGKHVPPAAGLRSPMEWGKEQGVRDLLGSGVTTVRAAKRDFVFRFTRPEEFADFFKENYGPTLKAFEALDDAGRSALYVDLVDLAKRGNRSNDGSVRLPAEYLEIVAERA